MQKWWDLCFTGLNSSLKVLGEIVKPIIWILTSAVTTVGILYYSINNIWKDDVNVLSRDGFFFTSNRQIFNDIPAWKSRLYSTAEVVELLIDHAEEMFVLKRQ